MNLKNRLAESTSPYLKQHANNPVAWQPWDSEALETARKEDKPIIVSIGYSACHWCHVMEHESFESQQVADIMNKDFVCIKVDREERPDVDQIYMDALHALGINGGWPLNVFLTPDQKPFYGGTYFPKDTWMRILNGISNAFTTKRQEIEEDATKVAEAVVGKDLTSEDGQITAETFDMVAKGIKERFDFEWGGIEKAPKFPMPSIWQFLIVYARLSKNDEIAKLVTFTSQKLTNGGIYDLVRGGFARYSVDKYWKVPHFEKMLYDNGQLLSVLSEVYHVSQDQSIYDSITKTCEWIRDEMASDEGGFYSALDADSEGVEGKFYTWTLDEVDLILKDDGQQFKDFFRISFEGNWEKGQNILFSELTADEYADLKKLDRNKFRAYLHDCYKKLKVVQDTRVRPGLDNKIIASWNGLAIEGLLQAYRATGEEWIRDLAVRNAEYISKYHIKEGKLYRIVDNKQRISAFLDDYASIINAFISVYQYTFDSKWLNISETLNERVLKNFKDESGYFFYTDSDDADLIARKKEMLDNVIPASNSIMAMALHRLGTILTRPEYLQLSKKMINGVADLISQHPEYLTNWAITGISSIYPTLEIAVTGANFNSIATRMLGSFIPNSLIAGSDKASELPLLKDRLGEKDMIYVCQNGLCHLPVATAEEAFDQIAELRS